MPPTLTAKQHHSKSLKRPAAASKPSNNKPPKAVAKPRLQQPATTNLCHGRSDAPCIFSVKNTGERARFHDKSLQCVWCNATLLEAACSTQTGKGNLSRALKFFWAHDKDIFHQACARLPAELRPCLPLKALGFPPSFSSPEHLCQTMSTPRSMGPLVASLRKKQAVDPMAVEEAIKAFPEDMQEQVQAKLAMEPNSVRKARARTRSIASGGTMEAAPATSKALTPAQRHEGRGEDLCQSSSRRQSPSAKEILSDPSRKKSSTRDEHGRTH